MKKLIVPKKVRQLPPPDNHIGRCVWIIDLGTQVSNFDDGKKQRRVLISFELPNEKTVFTQEKGEEPFVVSKEYSLTLGPKSNLRRDIQSWLGRNLNESEMVDFDLGRFLGKAALVNVIHEASKKTGEEHAKIIGITSLLKTMQAPAQINPSILYSIEDGRGGAFDQLPDWVQKKICTSEELGGAQPSVAEITERNVRQATENALSANGEAENAPAQEAVNDELEEIDIPF